MLKVTCLIAVLLFSAQGICQQYLSTKVDSTLNPIGLENIIFDSINVYTSNRWLSFVNRERYIFENKIRVLRKQDCNSDWVTTSTYTRVSDSSFQIDYAQYYKYFSDCNDLPIEDEIDSSLYILIKDYSVVFSSNLEVLKMNLRSGIDIGTSREFSHFLTYILWPEIKECYDKLTWVGRWPNDNERIDWTERSMELPIWFNDSIVARPYSDLRNPHQETYKYFNDHIFEFMDCPCDFKFSFTSYLSDAIVPEILDCLECYESILKKEDLDHLVLPHIFDYEQKLHELQYFVSKLIEKGTFLMNNDNLDDALLCFLKAEKIDSENQIVREKIVVIEELLNSQ
ncbi:MAG: hypothetical protein QNK23_00165 [Crocinitomicaceae bacterium]|nr:hypothetical protein [Crocinitomicaceae bacterium]